MAEKRKKRRVDRGTAQLSADRMSAWLAARGDTFVLVGSMRRGRPYVGDIEFVVLPKDLRDFHEAMTKVGFRSGEKRRNYVGAGYYGVPVEIYVAHAPDELGAMMLAYTGDYLFNIAMRSKAKRMGYRMDQYGIWKGNTPVLQSADEREFFDFLGMDYHTAEERSLARRVKLQKIARGLLKSTRDPEEKAFAKRVLEVLKGRTPLSRYDEDLLGKGMTIYGFYMSGQDSLGFQLPGEEDAVEAREVIQGLYDSMVGRGGTVMYLDVNMAYNVVQVMAAVREGEGEDVIYLLMELTDLPGDELERIAIDSREFLSSLVMAAGRGEVEFSWQGPWRPMVE
jgi:hypothetical protein